MQPVTPYSNPSSKSCSGYVSEVKHLEFSSEWHRHTERRTRQRVPKVCTSGDEHSRSKRWLGGSRHRPGEPVSVSPLMQCNNVFSNIEGQQRAEIRLIIYMQILVISTTKSKLYSLVDW